MKDLNNKAVLTTERLILRHWEKSDAEDLFFYAKDPEISYPTGFPVHKSVENSREIIKTVLNGSEAYAVCLKEDNKPVGAIELMMKFEDRPDECELGFWIAKPLWGRGLIPEAASELLRRGFEELGMSKIWCGYYDGNEKSKRVQEKLGFKYQLTKENVDLPALGEKRTEHINLLTKEDWENENSCI